MNGQVNLISSLGIILVNIIDYLNLIDCNIENELQKMTWSKCDRGSFNNDVMTPSHKKVSKKDLILKEESKNIVIIDSNIIENIYDTF